MIRLPLSKNKFVIIDENDYFWVSKFKLFACGDKSKYAGYCVYEDGKWKSKLLHRKIIKARGKQIVDHIDGDPLNCRRSNLRIVPQRINVISGRKIKDAKGCYLDKRRNIWYARIRISSSERLSLGAFKTEKLASIAYKQAVKKYHENSFGNTRINQGENS